MLSLRLKSGDYISIGNNIAVQIFKQPGDSFQVAVKAPREVPVLRGDVYERSEEKPEGLRQGPSKTPSELRTDAKRLAALARREERRAAVREISTVLDKLENCDEVNEVRRLLEKVM